MFKVMVVFNGWISVLIVRRRVQLSGFQVACIVIEIISSDRKIDKFC